MKTSLIRKPAWGMAVLLLLSLTPVRGANIARTWVPLRSSTTPLDALPATALVSETPADGQGITITMDIPGFFATERWADNQSFTLLELDGWSTLQEVGKPALPFRTFMLEIPAGTTPAIQLSERDTIQLENYLVMPAQPPLPDVYPEPPPPDFAKDDAVYGSSASFPSANIVDTRTVTLRDKNILILQVTPFQARGDLNQLEAAWHLEIAVEFVPQGPAALPSRPDSTEADDDLQTYMILMDDQFEDNALLQELAEWKARKGYEVVLVKTSDINANGAPTAAENVAWMRALSDEAYPDFLLILGDHTEANGVAGTYFNSSSSNYYGYTDLDLACRNDSDYIPDLYYGRLPATDTANASNMLQKVIAMDRQPPTNSYLQNICVAGQIQDSDDGNNRADRLFCETADAIACYFEQDGNGLDYSCERALVNPDNVDENCYWASGSVVWNSTDQIGNRVFQHFMSVTDARNRIIDNVNRGAAIVQHRDHGYVNGVGWADPYFTTSYVNNYLTNGARRTVVFSVNCNSGMYQFSDNFARAWIQHNNGGAYAVFAPVDTSYSWYNDFLTHGFYTAFLTNYTTWHNTSVNPEWPKTFPAPNGAYGEEGMCNRLGQILNFGKMYMYEKFYPHETTFRLFHLLGDPESFIRIANLQPLNVSHSSVLTPGVQTVEVTVDRAGADVCLYAEALSLHQRITTTNTVASFSVSLSNTGTIHVTAYSHDRVPYEGVISVEGSIPDYDVAITDVTLSSDDVYADAPVDPRPEEAGRQRDIRTTLTVPEDESKQEATTDAAISASVTVKNWGATTVNAGTLCVWANQGVLVTAPATGDQQQTIGTLGAGESRVVTFTGLDAGDGLTRRAFRAFIDCADITPETNEANNQVVRFYPDNPVLSTFSFTAVGRTDNVGLTWNDPVACGLSNATIMIRYSTNSAPADIHDGTLLYSGGAFEYDHTGLLQNQPYYYRIWVSQDGSSFIDPPGGAVTASATPRMNPIQLLVRCRDSFVSGGKTKSLCRVLPFLADGSGLVNTTALPATFSLATKWVIAGTGDFNPSMDGQEILLRDSSGTFCLLYIDTDGALDWSSDTNSVYWTSFATGSAYATNAGAWAVDAIGDVTGDGQDEVIVRDGGTFVQGGKTKTRLRVLTFDPAGSGQLASTLPNVFSLATTWTIEGPGHFTASPPGACSTNAQQLLLRHATDGGFFLLYFTPEGNLYWNVDDTNDLCWTSFSAGASFSDSPNDWSVVGIGDINGDGRDELLMKNADTFQEGGKTKSYYRTLFFSDADDGHLATEQPGTFKLADIWSAEAIGNFNICDANSSLLSEQLLLRRPVDGGLFLLYFNDDGTVFWDDSNETNFCWTSFTPGAAFSETPARMSIQGCGDLMGLRD